MRAATRLYQLVLRAYPAAFRRRHGAEMRRIFTDDWRAARRSGLLATFLYGAHIFWDVVRTAPHERLGAMTRDNWFAGATAVFCGAAAAWIDFRASEVQSTLLVLVVGAACFSYLAEKRTWRWPLAVAAWLPAAHLAASALGREHGAHVTLAHSRIVLPALAMLLVALAAVLAGVLAGRWLRRLLPPRTGVRAPWVDRNGPS